MSKNPVVIWFRWDCPQCRKKGRVAIAFPIEPVHILTAVAADHIRAQPQIRKPKFPCMASALTIRPEPLRL